MESKSLPLTVTSNIRKYILGQSPGMNLQGKVPEVLSQKLRVLLDKAIASAKEDGRKTVMERDFE